MKNCRGWIVKSDMLVVNHLEMELDPMVIFDI